MPTVDRAARAHREPVIGPGTPVLHEPEWNLVGRGAGGSVTRSVQLLAPVLLVGVAVALMGAPTRPYGDEAPLLHGAMRILDGHYAVPGTAISTNYLWHGPGLPAFLAPLIALHVPLGALRMTGPVLLFASTVIFHRLLLRSTSEGKALGGAYALGLYVPFAYVLPSLHKEPLALLCVTTALLAHIRYEQTRRGRFGVAAGLALGALVMVRLEYGWVILALAILAGAARLVRRAPALGRAFIVYTVAVAACCPWLLYTYRVTGRPLYWGNSGGLSLFWTAAPAAPQLGQWHAVHSVLGRGADPALAHYRPLFAGLARLSPLGRDIALQGVALHDIATRPAHFALNVLANLSRLLFAFPMSPGPNALELSLLALSSTALLGAVIRAVRRPRRRADLPVAPFGVLLAAGVAVHLVPAAEPRMMFPLVPICVWFAACMGGAGDRQRNVKASRPSSHGHRITPSHRWRSDREPVAMSGLPDRPARQVEGDGSNRQLRDHAHREARAVLTVVSAVRRRWACPLSACDPMEDPCSFRWFPRPRRVGRRRWRWRGSAPLGRRAGCEAAPVTSAGGLTDPRRG